MDLSAETDGYIRESIESSLGLQVSATTLQLKLLASEDERRRLQDHIFTLQDRIRDTDHRLEQYKAEATMNAQGLRKCIEEKEVMTSGYMELVNHCAKLEKECALYERDIEKIMESCDELGKENDELRAREQVEPSVTALVAEVESLQKEKESLRINLDRAEEEVKVMVEEVKVTVEENRVLKEQNERLKQLNREAHLQESDNKYSTSASARGKRKSCRRECSPGRAIDLSGADSSRLPMSPLHSNSPDSRMRKK